MFHFFSSQNLLIRSMILCHNKCKTYYISNHQKNAIKISSIKRAVFNNTWNKYWFCTGRMLRESNRKTKRYIKLKIALTSVTNLYEALIYCSRRNQFFLSLSYDDRFLNWLLTSNALNFVELRCLCTFLIL